MSLANYPASLPLPLLEGYGLKRRGNHLRGSLTTGSVQQRKRFTRVPTELAASFRLTASEAQQLEAFVADTLFEAAAWFQMDVLTPSGLVSHQVRFSSDPREDCQPNGPALWEYRARIEVRQLATISDEEVANAVAAPNTVDNFVQGVDDAVDSYQE